MNKGYPEKCIIFCLLSCFFLVTILSCNSQKKTITSFDHFPLEVTDKYSKVWSEEFSNNLGRFYFYELKKPKIFRNIPIEGQFRLDPKGALKSFTLSKTFNFNGTLIPRGSSYSRYEEDSYFFTLSKDTIIQGFPVFHREEGFIFWKENNVYFYNDGTIKGFALSEDMIIKKIPCNAAKKSRSVELFQNGELRHCKLEKDLLIQGFPCQGGDKENDLWFRKDGELLSFFLSCDFIINGKEFSKGTQIIFDKKKKPSPFSGHLKFMAFYDNDILHNVVLEKELEVMGITFPKGSRILFNREGKIDVAKPVKNILIEGIPCKKKKWVGFYPNGKLKWCTISHEVDMDGILYSKGSKIQFNESGRVKQ